MNRYMPCCRQRRLDACRVIDGHHVRRVVAKGVAAGPEVARILRSVEARWIAEGFPDRARVRALLAQELAGKTRS